MSDDSLVDWIDDDDDEDGFRTGTGSQSELDDRGKTEEGYDVGP